MSRKTLVLLAALMCAASARAQTVSVEVNQAVGYSTDDVAALATQVRAFGDISSGTRFKIEGAWADRSADNGDAFQTAYPYGDRVQLIEAYGEHLLQPGLGLLAIKAGRYRTPFGIYEASDHAYFGFLRAPLIRYDDYYALSNSFLEQGVDVVVGRPQLSLEASAGVPGDVSNQPRRMGFDMTLRGQGAFGPLVVGGSYVSSQPHYPDTFAFGRAAFYGVDARWMHSGVQLRGEWLWGQPFDGTSTTGGYVDLIVHRPSMGPVTAVARAERLVYDAVPPFGVTLYRYIAGTRVRLFDRLAVDLEVVRQPTEFRGSSPTSLDVGLSFALRHDSHF